MTYYYCPKCEKITFETKDYDLLKNKPCIICSTITRPLVNKIEVKERIKKDGKIWEFHKYDKDPFPSNPHGHNKEAGEKLNVYNGLIYNKNKQPIDKLKIKSLEKIQNKLKEKGSISQQS